MIENLINNRTESNHRELIEKSLKVCDEFFLVSPFLSSNFDFFPFKRFRRKLIKITLVTTLKPRSIDQVDKVEFFDRLFKFGDKNKITIEILIDNTLHGKIYVFKAKNYAHFGIITSANFTRKGLSFNNEWGVKIEDYDTLKTIEQNIRENVVLKKISKKDIDRFKKEITKTKPVKSQNSIDLNLIEAIKINTNPLLNDQNTTYWLKPVGTKEKPIPWEETFSTITEKLYFSNRRPEGVKIGHILITYAVRHKNILSIYRVTSGIYKTDKKKERFPFYVYGENLTPYYGDNWQDHNLNISDQRLQFLNETNYHIAQSGNDTYGLLMRGGDKMRITSEYAEYLIKKVVKINQDLATMANNR